jgi:branched-chain amino acid transport system ATP-binding protein
VSFFEVFVNSVSYGKITSLDSISITSEKGKLISILGANSAGKTTALLSIMGSVKCKERSVKLEGKDLSKLPTWQLARAGIAFCADEAPCFNSLSVIDNLEHVYRVNDVEQSLASSTLDYIFSIFPVLKTRSKQKAGTLSGGERKMLAISRLLMMDPKVLLIDEPSSGLSPIMTTDLYKAIGKIKEAGNTAIIIAEQNATVALKISDYCILLNETKVIGEGHPDVIQKESQIDKAYFGA